MNQFSRTSIRLLSISSMFPNNRMPVHAQFVKQRLDALSKHADLTVVAPIPWFPGETIIPKYRNRHQVSKITASNRYPTYHPRFLSIPGVLKPLDGIFMALAVYFWWLKQGHLNDFDIIDCHLGFPDGFVGALLAKIWRKPFIITLRGHDINDLYRYPIRIRQVLFALRRCSRFFGVSQALVDGAIQLGAPAAKGYRSSNGVDSKRFFRMLPIEARTKLAIDPQFHYMLSVSHIVKRKGIDILLRAFALLRERGHLNLRYIIVGSGGEEGDYTSELKNLADSLGISPYVLWAGAVENTNLHLYYSAADISCLASEKEGWPNVILESLACGTPVAAHAVWGVPEIISDQNIGILVKDRTPESFANAISLALNKSWDTEAITNFAREHSWEKTSDELFHHLTEILGSQQNKCEAH